MWFNKKDKKVITISNSDRNWVNNEFLRLLQRLGYPKREMLQYDFNKKYFPKTFNERKMSVENLITDISKLLFLDHSKITYEFINDLRDEKDIPYIIKGKNFETKVNFINKKYHIIIANSIKNNNERVLYNLAYELSKIKLKEIGFLREITPKTYYDVFMAGVFFGFGVILSQQLIDIGRKTNGLWEIKWNYNSGFPPPVMAYTLALFSIINDNTNPDWKNNLPNDIKKEYQNCIIYIHNENIDNIDLYRLKAYKLSRKAKEYSKKKEYEKEINLYLQASKLTNYGKLLAIIFNNIGYTYLKMNNIDKSIYFLQKSLEIFPSSEYANNNIGYAYIRKNQIELGKKHLDIINNPNDKIVLCYKYRNLGLYYLKKNDIVNAKKYFQKSFDCKIDIDRLEYHYAELLLKTGQKDKAEKCLRISQKKGEK